MKTLRMIGMALFTVLMCVNFASCSNDDNDINIEKQQLNEYGLPVKIANNVIYYKTSNGQPLSFGIKEAKIKVKSNTYLNGYGTIEFNSDLTTLEGCKIGDETVTIISFPASLNEIDNFLFKSSMNSLQTILVDENNACYSSYDGCLYDKKQSTLIYCPQNKTSISFPATIVTIGHSSCERTALTEVNIPDNVTVIEGHAFEDCKNLANITFPKNLIKIGVQAFCFCESLQSITLPEKVNSIGFIAFEMCSSLSKIYCKATTPPTLDDQNIPRYPFPYGVSIYVPSDSYDEYKSAKIWDKYKNFLVPYKF